MGVPAGHLSDNFRAAVRDFYGPLFGWEEIDSLSQPDRFALTAGGQCYLNIREVPDPIRGGGYEHFGVTLSTPEEVEAVRTQVLEAGIDATELLAGPDGFRSFRFRHLLPLAVEVQHFP